MTSDVTNSETNTPETNFVATIPNPCLRQVNVEIPAEVVTEERNKLIQQYSKLARVPGFRRGKVPAGVVRTRFAHDIDEEIVKNLVPRYFRQETEKQNLAPVSQPQVTDMHLHEGEALKFTAEFEILPEFPIEGYKGIKVEHPAVSVTDEEVDEAINNIRERRASFDPVEDRPAQDGDFAQISFTARDKNDESAAPTDVPSLMVEIGGKDTVQEFSDNLRGGNPGDERAFDVAYAEDYPEKSLAGKTLSYNVTVKSLKKKTVPELNDQFATELGADLKTVDELRQKIREGLLHEKEHNAEHDAKDKLVDQLVALNDFPIPQSMVEHQIEVRLERGLRALAYQGMREEDMRKMDFGRLREGQREAATREVKASLLLDKIAGEENVEVTEEDIDKEIAAVARQTQQPPEAVRSRLTQDGSLDRIRTRIRNEKTLDLLYSRSA